MGTLPTYSKQPLTVEQQLALLVARGLVVDDEAFTRHALENVSYYRLSATTIP